MLHVNSNVVHVGFINEGILYPIEKCSIESREPALVAKDHALDLELGGVSYSFSRKNITKFYWCSNTITFEWDYNTGPKIRKNGKRTADNPLKLNFIEGNVLSFTVKPEDRKVRERFKRLFSVKDELLPVRHRRQHVLEVPEDLSLTVGLYLETLLSVQIPRGSITPNFWKVLRGVSDEEAISALMLMKAYDGMIMSPTNALQHELRKLREMEPEDWPSAQEQKRQHINSALLVFQVEVTPTKMYVTGPFLEKSCRVLRTYWKYRDHFVRVRFTDEDGSLIPACDSEIADYISDVLTNGISLAGRTFKFLAWSNSQLRSHSCFLFAPIVDGNYVVNDTDIIDKLGDFWDDTAPKHGARIGQCLTATVGGLHISVDKCQVIKDVKRNGYVFSDGVGTASYEVMQRAQKRLKLADVPSAIQIRYGGAKGVLSLDDRLQGLAIRLRPSMQKFDSKHKDLEITGHSTYRIGFLNRQMITLLQSLRTNSTDLRKLETALTSKIDELLAGTLDEETLNQLTWGHSKAILQETIETIGFEDGFLRALANKHARKALKSLITKTRIPVPNSAYAMGVLDEYGCLEEDEVFYRGLTESGEESSMEGDVIVIRSPCLHAGDVRKLKAVHRYELSHHKNIIVFSRKGQRPVPNMISGGDLDGDHYTIIADKSICPKFTVPPMDYTPPKQTSEHARSYPDANIEFFVHYLANDNLGKVANTWQAQCELQPRGALSPIATQLAHLHSTIVDFPKTGISATLPDDCKTSMYPDYMGKQQCKSFKAKSFIGQSYRRVIKKYGDPFAADDYELEEDDDLSSYPGNEDWYDDALDAYELYHFEMQGLIKAFNASSDVDIVTGILPPGKRRRGRKSNHVERLDVAFEELKNRFLQRFRQGTSDNEERLAKASAWYRAAYESYKKPVFASFAWILAEYLREIKDAANARRSKKRYRR